MLKRDDSETGFDHIVYGREGLQDLLPHWRDLAMRAAEDCVYYSPDYALALLGSVAARTKVRIVTCWSGGRLMGLLPVVLQPLPVPGLIAAGAAWQTDYTFSCTPLLDGIQTTAAAESLVTALASLKPGEWVLPDINTEAPAARALLAALAKRGAPWRIENDFERASLSTGLSFEEHMQSRVASKRRRELARNRRRLEDIAPLTLRTETHGKGLADAAQAFLALEASGWKGERGTALACAPDTKRFAELAFGNAAEEGRARIDLLLLDGKPIAAGCIVFAGRTGFTVKGAYDEAYASHSAGLVLEQEVIKSFLTGKWDDRLDAATNGSHVIDYLWPDRVKVGTLSFSLARRGADARLAALSRTNAHLRNAKAKLKALLKR